MEPESSLRERLIDVGVDVVMTDGPASLGLREIARRAGVSHGAPRRYFPTHHALLSAIARRGFADLASRFEAAAGEDASPRDRLQGLARTYLRYASEHRGMFELMFRHDLLYSGETQSAGLPPLRASTLPMFSHFVELVSRHTAERAAAGRTAPAAVTAAALWANLHGVAQLGAWGSLQLALDAASPGVAPDDPVDGLLMVVLDAHLGPVDA